MDKCKSCAYSCALDIGSSRDPYTACVYILHTGKCRPCPPGKDCAVYEPRPKDGAGR